MAPPSRGRVLLDSDSSESDRDQSDDDDVSDAEDAQLRRAVRERAAQQHHQQQRQRHKLAGANDASHNNNRADEEDEEDEEDEDVMLCGDASGGGGGGGGVGAGAAAEAAPRLVQGVNAGQIGPELAKLRRGGKKKKKTRPQFILCFIPTLFSHPTPRTPFCKATFRTPLFHGHVTCTTLSDGRRRVNTWSTTRWSTTTDCTGGGDRGDATVAAVRCGAKTFTVRDARSARRATSAGGAMVQVELG